MTTMTIMTRTDELIEEFKELVTICYMMMVACINAYEFFNANKLLMRLKRKQFFR